MLRLTCCLIVGLGSCLWAEPVPAPVEKIWSVRSYRFTDELLVQGFDTKDQGKLTPPTAPVAKAAEAEIVKFIKRSNQILSTYFSQLGYAPPAGSLLEFDPKSLTLVARTTENYHELLAALAQQMMRNRVMIMTGELSILEAESAEIRSALAAAATSANHAEILDRLGKLAEQGKARRVADLQLETKSGQRVKVSANTERSQASDFTVEPNFSTATTQEMRPFGTSLELDPIMGEDGQTIDVTYAVHHDFAPPTERWEAAAGRIVKEPVETRLTDFHATDLTSSVTIMNGTVKLLGVWKPQAAAPNQPEVQQIAFLRMGAQRLMPLENPLLSQWMTAQGEQVSPTPKEAPPLPEGVPAGMTIRLLHVPAAWWPLADPSPAVAADPFASADGPGRGGSKSEPRFTTKATVLELLRAYGLPLPEGSSATYDIDHEIVLIRSTPEIIAQVLPWFRDGRKHAAPKTLGLTAHVVQADGAMLRKLLADSRKVTDHTAQWQAIEASLAQAAVTIPSSVWIETKSGQRSKSQSGHDFMTVETSLDEFSVPSGPATAAKPADKKDAPAPVPTTINLFPQAERTLNGSHKSQHVGTTLEIDPVIGEDGQTVDLQLALDYDYAPPTQHPTPERDPGKFRIEDPGTDFHRANLNLGTTMLSGTWRMVGIWKPQGTPEFDGKDLLQAMFIRADILSAAPAR